MKYGLFGKFTSQPGKRDELTHILMRGAALLERNEDCIHYVVSLSDEADVIWVTEVWNSKEAHDTSLKLADVRILIQQAMPLVASMSNQIKLQVIGGKGL